MGFTAPSLEFTIIAFPRVLSLGCCSYVSIMSMPESPLIASGSQSRRYGVRVGLAWMPWGVEGGGFSEPDTPWGVSSSRVLARPDRIVA